MVSTGHSKLERMALKSYRELTVWQKAMDLLESVYQAVRGFPKEEIYGLTSQLKRAVVFVPSNIAEGQGANPRVSSYVTCRSHMDR